MNDDLHVRLLRRIARSARREADATHATDQPGGRPALRRMSDVADARLAAAQARRREVPPPPHEPSPVGPEANASRQREPSINELRSLVRHTRDQLVSYRRRGHLGHGEPRRLAELERIAAGARDRLTRALAREKR